MRAPALILLALLAMPAAAAATPPPEAIEEAPPSPEAVERGAIAMERMMDALLGLRIGPLAQAIDPGDPDVRRGDTLRDMLRRDDPHFEERAHQSLDAVAEGMSVMIAQMARLAPVLRDRLEDLERRMDGAMGESLDPDAH